jgi:hypothetical protein
MVKSLGPVCAGPSPGTPWYSAGRMTLMWHFFHLIVRPAEALLGIFCVLTAIVLYPNEEGKIQSTFEDFWVRVDDYQRLALSRHAAFMQQVARLESSFLNRVFGHKLFSGRAVGVSFSLSIATVCISGLINIFNRRLLFARSFGLILFGLLVACAAYICIRNYTLRACVIVIASAFAAWNAYSYFGYSLGYVGAAGIFFLLLGALGFLCDIAFVAATRRMLRLAGEMSRSLNVALVIVVNFLLALALIGPFLVGLLRGVKRPSTLTSSSDVAWSTVRMILAAISLTNIFDAVLALLFVFLALILLIHRATWPLLARTLFKMQDIGTKGRRAILTAVGMALLSASIFHEKIPDLLKEVIKAFGG